MSEAIILKNLRGLDRYMEQKLWEADGASETMVELGLAVGALLSLFLVGKLFLKTLSGQGQLDLMAIGRPVLFALILSNWFLITEVVFGWAKPLEESFQLTYELNGEELDVKRAERTEAARKLELRVREKRAQADYAASLEKDDLLEGSERADLAHEQATDHVAAEYFSEFPTEQYLGARAIVVQSKLMDWVEKTVLWIGEMFWELAIYFVFLTKHIGTAVLVIFGPVMMAASVAPAFQGAWKTWLGQSVTLSFYGVVAYLVMILSQQVIKYGVQTDINLLNDTLQDDVGLFSYLEFASQGGLGTMVMYVIALFCGGQLVLHVPQMATWIFPGDVFHGAGHFHAGLRNTIQTGTKETVLFVGGLVTGGLAAGVQAASIGGGGDDSDDGDSLGFSGLGSSGSNPSGISSPEAASYFAGASSHPSTPSPAKQPASGRHRRSRVSDNRWYADVLGHTDHMKQLARDLEAYEQAVADGNEAEFLQQVMERGKVEEEEKDTLGLDATRQVFWQEVTRREQRRRILQELDELINRFEQHE